MHHRTTKDVQSGMRSKKNSQGRERTNFTRSSPRRMDTARISTKPNVFRNDVSTKAKITATGLPIHFTERIYLVDSGASLQMEDDLL